MQAVSARRIFNGGGFSAQIPSTSVCGQRGREIDGMELTSSRNALYSNSVCVVKLKADSESMMINVAYWKVTDCSVQLRIYYTSSSSYSYNMDDPDVSASRSQAPTSLVSFVSVLRCVRRAIPLVVLHGRVVKGVGHLGHDGGGRS